jgi:predicted GIY-YIG superfamily endonuclease
MDEEENSEEPGGGVPGTIYLLCFAETPLHHAKHYSGWTTDLKKRLNLHAKGRGSCLMAAVVRAGIKFQVAKTWEGTRHDERKFKQKGGASKSCPICQAKKKKNGEIEKTKLIGDSRA